MILLQLDGAYMIIRTRTKNDLHNYQLICNISY